MPRVLGNPPGGGCVSDHPLARLRRGAAHAGLPALLRAAVLGVSAPVLCWPFTTGAGALAAAIAAFGAALAADLGQREGAPLQRLRLSTVVAASALAALLGWAGSLGLLRGSAASWLGPSLLLHAAEALFWGAAVGAVVLGLRFAALRYPTAGVLELVAVAAAFAAGLAAHRQGMVHRPLAIGDWAWSRGLDPTVVFLALGGICVLLLAALLVSEQRRHRLPLHFAGLVAVALMLVLFVRVSGLPQPRVPADLGLTGNPEETAEPGEESDDLELRDLPFRDEYSSAGQQAPVAVVLLRDDYSPPSGVYYFRQSAFSQYNGRRLVQATRADVDRDIVREFPATRQEVSARPPDSEHRRLLDTTVGLLVDHVRPFALDSPLLFEAQPNPSPLRFQRVFDARSAVPTLPYPGMLGLRPGTGDWANSKWEHYLEAPTDPRYEALARELTGALRESYRSDPLARALAVKFYLDRNGRYSRKSQHAGESDPAASFLFGDLTGYCVHFAHAATYLFRSLGIPARVAAGYAVPEEVRGNGSALLIQGLNAHAWPEIYLEGVGWVVVDLAPETVLDEFAPQPDPNLQQLLADLLRGGASYEQYKNELAARSFPLEALALGLAALAVALLVAASGVKLYRRLAPRYLAGVDLHRVAYRAALDRLSEVGLRRRFGESRERFAERAAPLSPTFGALTSEHLRCALGGRPGRDPEELRRFAAAVAPEIAERVPLWRRGVGTANPFSWWSAR